MPKNLSNSPKTLSEAIKRLIHSHGASTSGSFGRIVMTLDGRPPSVDHHRSTAHRDGQLSKPKSSVRDAAREHE